VQALAIFLQVWRAVRTFAVQDWKKNRRVMSDFQKLKVRFLGTLTG